MNGTDKYVKPRVTNEGRMIRYKEGAFNSTSRPNKKPDIIEGIMKNNVSVMLDIVTNKHNPMVTKKYKGNNCFLQYKVTKTEVTGKKIRLKAII